MKVFLAGATGVIGSRLALLLRDAKHDVTGTTRDPAKVSRLQALGIKPVAVDAFDADAMARSVASTEPDVVIHQLTDLPSAPGTPGYAVGQEANRRLRIEGTRNLVRAAAMAGVRRVIAQSIAFAYAPGEGPKRRRSARRQRRIATPLNCAGHRRARAGGVADARDRRRRASVWLLLWAGHLVRRASQIAIGPRRCGGLRRVALAEKGKWRLQHR